MFHVTLGPFFQKFLQLQGCITSSRREITCSFWHISSFTRLYFLSSINDKKSLMKVTFHSRCNNRQAEINKTHVYAFFSYTFTIFQFSKVVPGTEEMASFAPIHSVPCKPYTLHHFQAPRAQNLFIPSFHL